MKYFGSLPENLTDATLKKLSTQQKKVNERYLNEARLVLAKYDLDSDREDRLYKRNCKNCYYIDRSRIGGSAMTMKECVRCNKKVMYSSTNTDHLCFECSDELDLCVRCLQKIEKGIE